MKKLHEVISEVLVKAGKPLQVKIIADIINEQKLWLRPSDKRPPAAQQISARISNYSSIFLRENGVVSLKKTLPEDRIARLAYNTNGWESPSGWYGKSKTKSSYEKTNGYGHEEWLLDFSKLIKGYHYGYLEPVNKNLAAYEGRTFNIYLFTVNSATSQKVWIGKINNAEVIGGDVSEEIKATYQRKGWYQEMKEDLEALGLNSDKLDQWSGDALFNVRFKPSDFELCRPYQHVSKGAISSYHYVLLHVRDEPNILERNKKFVLGNCKPGKRFEVMVLKKKYEQGVIEYPFIHHEISRGLEKVLKKDFTDVYVEHDAICGGSIDLVASKGKIVNFYEIKTYNDVRTCIRQGIGQLLEYSYFPSQKLATEMFIVTPHVINDLDTINYLRNLRKAVKLPIRHLQFDLESGKVGQVI